MGAKFGATVEQTIDDALLGCVLGTAVGDALGLRYEGLSAGTIARLCPGSLRPIAGGAVSDDTEQTVLLAAAAIEAGSDLARFRSSLRAGLRRWFLALPPGVGFGTARALALSCLGVWDSGVRSAGNGAAMRVAPLGLLAPADALDAWVIAASEITHTDRRAVDGARIVAHAVRSGASGRQSDLSELPGLVGDPAFRAAIEVAVTGSVDDVLQHLGLDGAVSGFVVHTVPVAIAVWRSHETLSGTVDAAVRLGGDTDTVAAIAGALAGATLGAAALDAELTRIPALPAGLGLPARAPAPGSWGALARNLWLLPRFLGHLAVRRLTG